MTDQRVLSNGLNYILQFFFFSVLLTLAEAGEIGKCDGNNNCKSNSGFLVLENGGNSNVSFKENNNYTSTSMSMTHHKIKTNVTSPVKYTTTALEQRQSVNADVGNESITTDIQMKFATTKNGTNKDTIGNDGDRATLIKNGTVSQSDSANNDALSLASVPSVTAKNNVSFVPLTAPSTAGELINSSLTFLNSTDQIDKNESIVHGTIPSFMVNTTDTLLESDSTLEHNSPIEILVSEMPALPVIVQNDPQGVEELMLHLEPSISQIKGVTKPNIPRPEHQFIKECGCQRNFFYSVKKFSDLKLNSSCSDEGTHYAPGQKIISFSLPRAAWLSHHNRSTNYKAIKENLLRMRYFYPGYTMRLYTDLTLDKTYCRFLCQNTDIFWCDIRNSIGDQSKMFYPTWKFLPLGDPSVDIFLSRDMSTFINERDAAVVQDWLKLNKTFHLMRDKRHIHNFPMLGGLWGGRNDLLVGDEGTKLREQIIFLSKVPKNNVYRFKNFDQDVLTRVIFYPRKKDIVAYDSYHCKQWKKFTMVRPFPVQRNVTVVIGRPATKGFASAAVAAIKKRYKLTKCPVECRPSYGKNWEYC